MGRMSMASHIIKCDIFYGNFVIGLLRSKLDRDGHECRKKLSLEFQQTAVALHYFQNGFTLALAMGLSTFGPTYGHTTVKISF